MRHLRAHLRGAAGLGPREVHARPQLAPDTHAAADIEQSASLTGISRFSDGILGIDDVREAVSHALAWRLRPAAGRDVDARLRLRCRGREHGDDRGTADAPDMPADPFWTMRSKSHSRPQLTAIGSEKRRFYRAPRSGRPSAVVNFTPARAASVGA